MVRWVSLGLLAVAGAGVARPSHGPNPFGGAALPAVPVAVKLQPVPPPGAPLDERPKVANGSARTIRPAAPGPDATPRTDLHGDPLPPGAVARLGTVRLRHGTEPSVLTFSPDGKLLASMSASEEGIRLWDPTSGKELARLRVPVSFACFGRDGTIIVADGQRAQVWAPLAGGTLRDLPENIVPEGATTLALHPDGKTLAAGVQGQPAKVVLIDLATGRPRAELKTAGDPHPTRLVFSPDGRWLAGTGPKAGVWLWNLRTNRRVRTYPAPADDAGIAFSPESDRLAITADGLHVFPLDGEEPVDGYTAPELPLGKPRFSPDGKFVFALQMEGGAVRIDAATGAVKDTWGQPDEGLHPPLALAPDGATAAAADVSGGIRIWQPKTGKGPEVERLPALFDPGLSADGKTASAVDQTARVRTFDPLTGKPGRVYELPVEEGTTVIYDARSGRAAAVVGAETPEVHVFDAATGKVLAKIPAPGMGLPQVAFSPTNKDRLVIVCPGAAAVVSVSAGRVVRSIDIGRPDNNARGWLSPDGRLLAVTTQPLSVWEVGTGKKRFEVDTLPQPLGAVFSPDGRLLAVWDSSDLVVVFDVRAGQVVRRFQLPGAEGGLNVAAFTPDGKRLVIGQSDGLITLWDVATGEPVLNLEQHDGAVTGLAFAADGSRLVSTAMDGTALVWDLSLKPRARAAAAVASPADAFDLLAAPDPARAQRGMEYLYQHPAEAVKLLTDRITVPAPTPAERIAKLVGDLGSPDFQTRRAAVAGLVAVGGEAIPAVRAAVEKAASPEVRKLGAEVLGKLDGPPTRPDDLRLLRAAEVLEGLGTPDARALLTKWAAGPPGNRLTVEAAAAVGRLKP